jgi:acyl-CoA synthetase (NDP forming)
MVDVDFGDLIDFLNDDYNTKSIVLYTENVGNARRFIGAARGFELQKPIVALKPGGTRQADVLPYPIQEGGRATGYTTRSSIASDL